MAKPPKEPSENSATGTARDTPMLRQYNEAKAKYPNHLLFFRLGDFYELFNADAQTAAGVLGITLTKRQDMPMAGVPVHTHEQYLARLLRQGFSVAVCDQIGYASEQKGLVQRDVNRVVTPG